MTISTNATVNGSTNDGIGGSGTGVITSYTAAQLAAMALAGTLTPDATYVASDIGEEFTAPAADLLVPSYARVRCSLPGFGGFWDHVGDDSPAIQAALDYAATFTPRRNIELPPKVLLKSSVFVKLYVKVYGYAYEEHDIPKTVIKVPSDMSLSTGFLFNFNTLNGTTEDESWEAGYRPCCGIYGVYLDNWTLDVAAVRLAIFAAQFQAHNIRSTRHTQILKRLGGLYTDNVQIRGVFAYHSHDNSEYAIELTGGTGAGSDAMEISQLNFPVDAAAPELAVKVSAAAKCKVFAAINGVYHFSECVNAEITHTKIEQGKIVFDSSSGVVRSCNIMMNSTESNYPFELVDTVYSTSNNTVGFDTVETYYGDYIHEPTSPADINTTSKYIISMVNCSRNMRMGGVFTRQGLRLNLAGSPVTAWNNNSYYLSQSGRFDGAYCHGQFDAVIGASVTGIWLAESVAQTSTLAAATYYYKAQLLLDVDNMIGVNQSSAEQSVVISTSNNRRAYLSCSAGANSTKQCILRVYRGTTTNSYNYYADLPMLLAYSMYDAGAIINGVAWVSRGAGAVDTLYGGTGKYIVTPTGGARSAVITALKTQAVAYAASISVNLALGNKVVVGALTAALTHNSPTNVPTAETEVRYEFTQNGTGGYGITWSALHKGSWPTASGTASQAKIVIGRSDGTNIIFVSDSGWY